MGDSAKEGATAAGADSYFMNKNGYKLFCKYWHPKLKDGEQPRALVFICHGVGEHCQRYDLVADPLTNKGFLVFSHDHVGHGRSEGVRVDICSFTDYTNDVIQHVDIIKGKYPDCPMFLFGHSMGGTIVVKTVLDNPDICQGAILSAPALHVDPNVVGGPFKIDDYDNDPLVWHGGMKARWGVIFFDMLDEIGERMSEFKCPVLNQHGDADKLCSLAGSQRLQDKASSSDKTLLVIPGGFHELHNEPDGVGVKCIGEIVSWIDARIK